MFELYSDAFLGCYCVLGMLTVHRSTKFLILVFMFLKYVILCVYPLMRSFVVQFLFIFHDIVWLVKSSCSVQCCSFHEF